MNKFTDMMRMQEGWKLHLANCERDAGNDNAAIELEAKAAVLRAMREAWESMVEALEMVYANKEYMPNPVCAALAKARGE